MRAPSGSTPVTTAQPIHWTEVRVLVPVGWHELVAEAITIGPGTTAAFGRPSLATDAPPDGFDFVRTFIPSHADTPELRAELTRNVAELARRAEIPELEGLALTFRAMPPEDYATSWMKSWKPFRVGKLCVLAPWTTSRTRASDVVMKLEPGGAFGSGRHGTTRMCLRVLQERIQGGELVLDCGSGSGILSVAAVLLGANRSYGFDNDPNALPYARALAQDNGLADRSLFLTAGFEAIDDLGTAFDVVIANIYSDVIRKNAARLHDTLMPGGWFAISGISMNHAHATHTALESVDLVIEETRVRGRWNTLIGRRRS